MMYCYDKNEHEKRVAEKAEPAMPTRNQWLAIAEARSIDAALPVLRELEAFARKMAAGELVVFPPSTNFEAYTKALNERDEARAEAEKLKTILHAFDIGGTSHHRVATLTEERKAAQAEARALQYALDRSEAERDQLKAVINETYRAVTKGATA